MLLELFYINFNKGNKINTKINIYYNKEDIQLEGTKFINSNFSEDLYNKKSIPIKGLKSGILYIVISNFQNDIEDTIIVFNNMEYYDLSKIEELKFIFYSKMIDFSSPSLTFSINNTNLKYSYFHFLQESINHFIFTESTGIQNLEENEYISLNKYKNKMIYIIFYFMYDTENPIIITASNYSLLYPLSNI